jgi:hypothetical protein
MKYTQEQAKFYKKDHNPKGKRMLKIIIKDGFYIIESKMNLIKK